jgi:cell division transport system permease protein
MRTNYVLSGVRTGLRRNLLMTVSLITITAVSLVFLGTALLANTEITRFRRDYDNKLNVSIYLCGATATTRCAHTITDAERETLSGALTKDPRIVSVSYVSVDQAYQRARQVLDPSLTAYLEPGQLPASYTVRLGNTGRDYAAVAAAYANTPGVDQVQNEDDSIKTILRLLDGARLASIIGAIVVMLSAVGLMAITIQVAASQRRTETTIMRLVGAARWMTQLPFMIEAVVAAAIGGLVAIVALWAGTRLVLNGIFRDQVGRGIVPDLSINDVLLAGGICLIASVVLSAITAVVTLRAYVRI